MPCWMPNKKAGLLTRLFNSSETIGQANPQERPEFKLVEIIINLDFFGAFDISSKAMHCKRTQFFIFQINIGEPY